MSGIRPVSSTTLNSIVADIVFPIYLVKLEYSPPILLSSREDLVYNGEYYVSAGIEVGDASSNEDSEVSRQIKLPNHSQGYTPIFLNLGIVDRACTIYETFDTNLAPADVTQIFYGHITEAAFDNNNVTLTVTAGRYTNMFSPRIFCSPPLCNWIPQPGTIVYIEGQIYEVKE